MTARTGAFSIEIEQRLPMPLSGRFGCDAGELLALVGPSGAGKSSMLRVLAGLLRPDSCRVEVGEEIWADSARGIFLPPQRRHVGLVFQHYALMPHLSAIDNVALGLLHLPPGERHARAADWLSRMHLSADQSGRKPAQLSGGQQQRVALARALAREPHLLLLDEPFSAVDHPSRRSLYRLLADLRRTLSIPIVLVTHDLAEARVLADSIVVLDAGRVLQQGRADAIDGVPLNARVAELLGARNLFRGVWTDAVFPSGLGAVRWKQEGLPLAEAPLVVVARPESWSTGQEVAWLLPNDAIALLDPEAVGANRYAADVVDVRDMGDTTVVAVRLAAAPYDVVSIVLAGARRHATRVGARMTLDVDPERVHVMTADPLVASA